MIKVKTSNSVQTGLYKQLAIEIIASGDWSVVAVAANDIASKVYNQYPPWNSNTYFLCYFEQGFTSGTVLYEVDDAGAATASYVDMQGRAHDFDNGTTNVYPQRGDVVQVFIQGASAGTP